MVALRFCVKFIGIVSTMVLARVLTPDDFGLMALASSVYAFVVLLRMFGFDVALIQNQNAGKAEYNTAWTFQVIFSSASGLLLLAVAQPVADYYEDPRLVGILFFMALIVFIDGFNNIGVVEFRKKLTFHKEFIFSIAVKISGVIITVPLAIVYESYWALLFGMLSSNIISLILSYVMQTFRPNFCLSAWKQIFSFSSWMVLNNAIGFLSSKVQYFILGKTVGIETVGLLSVSEEVATLTTTELVGPINRATFPGYSKVADSKKELTRLYVRVLSYIAMIAIPTAFGIAVTSELSVPLLLGDQWLEAIILVKWLALGSVLASINTNSGYIYMALGIPKITTILASVRLCFFLPILIYLSTNFGVLGVAMTPLITGVLMFPLYQIMLCRVLNIKFYVLISPIYRPMLAGGCMMYVVSNVISHWSLQEGYLYMDIIKLFSCMLIGAVVFFMSVYLLWLISGKSNGVETDILKRLNFRIL